jgi:hypothetical protein
MQTTLAAALRIVIPSKAHLYTMHSFRIYLACALLAAKASDAQIQSLVRWQTLESLHIYARLNASDYAGLLDRAHSADIGSIQATNLPPCDDTDTDWPMLLRSLSESLPQH